LIPVQVGGVEIEVEAVPVAGTELMSGRASEAAGGIADPFGRVRETIIEMERSTAAIEPLGAPPDRLVVRLGPKLSASGGVIMARVVGEASSKVSLSYDVAGRPVAERPWEGAEEAAEKAVVAGDVPRAMAGRP
jgi:hypothetical protein